VLRGSW